MPQNKKNTLFLVDGSGFIFRAYHALPPMNRPDGTPVNAVLGFCNMLVKLISDMHAPAMAVIFDAARKNYRNDIYADYKANRDEPPEDLRPQFALIREATEAFNLPALALEGYEADDLIATYARLARERGIDVVIVSSDKDLMQLVRDGVRMFDPMKSKYMEEADVLEKFGVTPDKVIDVQSLAGDSIDNVPGVPGIGIKTAAQLINEYGDLETLLNRAGEIKQPKRREALIDNAEMARISKKLVALDNHVDAPLSLDDLEIGNVESEKLVSFLKQQGFKSIITRLQSRGGFFDGMDAIANGNDTHPPFVDPATDKIPDATAPAMPPVSDNTYTLIQDAETLRAWADAAMKTGILAVDTETTSLTPAKAELVGISIAHSVGSAAYIPLSHKNPQVTDLLSDPAEHSEIKQMKLRDVVEILAPVMADPSVLKIGHNIKYDLQVLASAGLHVTPYDDTMLISYVLDGHLHGHGMDELSETLLGHKPIAFKDVAGTGKSQVTFDYVPLEKACEYAAEDAEITLRLHHVLKPRIASEKMAVVYETIERPLSAVIAQMETHGVKVDPMILKDLSRDFSQKLVVLEQEIHKMAGHEFNIASPKQMGVVLFEEMGLSGSKKTKTGDWSTSVDVLEMLSAQGHEIVDKILEWRQLSKLRSTYTEALQAEINPKTGRVHTSYSMAGTSTGRLASSEPNLQNIPIRTEEGRKIRTAFVAETGHKLLSVDYSQVELRLAAGIAKIRGLQQAFKDGADIHAATASQVFDVPLSEMTPEIRRKAKAINFGIIYGISGWGLAKQLGIEPGEANAYIKAYFTRFPELATFMEETKEFARQHGFVRTLYGRKCYTPGINDKNPARRAFSERAAINAPLQGTAADIMKRAMLILPDALKDAGLHAKMLLQVHDELIFEVPDAEVEATQKLVKQVMEDASPDGIPLIADAKTGLNWDEAH